MKEHEIQDQEKHLKALSVSLKRASERLNNVGLKDPKEVLDLLFDEVAQSEYKTEVIKHLLETIDNLKRQIK